MAPTTRSATAPPKTRAATAPPKTRAASAPPEIKASNAKGKIIKNVTFAKKGKKTKVMKVWYSMIYCF